MSNPIDDYIRKLVEQRLSAVEAAIVEVGMAGGGKVVLPHPWPVFRGTEPVIRKILIGQSEDDLPNPRIEHLVPDLRSIIYRED